MSTIFSGENAYRHLEVLARDIGPRHGGSKNEARAAEYICEYFATLGLDASIQSYPIYSFENATASLTGPGGEDIACVPIPISGITDSGGVTADVVFLEGNDAAHLDESVRGRIVVMFDSFQGEVQRRFHALEPTGLVSIQTRAEMKHIRKPAQTRNVRKTGTLPSVLMTLEDGLKLVDNLPPSLTLKVFAESEQITEGCNVIADIKGSEPDDDIYGICAHFDSVWAGPGAFDNGGGAAAIMELARAYSEKGTRRNIRFLAFGGEEMGVWGSKHYVKVLSDDDKKLKEDENYELDGMKSELDRHRFLVNLDMMGPLYGRSTAVTLGHSDIAASVRLLANEIRYAINIRENVVYSSDNMTFNYVGIPSLSFYRGPFQRVGGHTSEDTIDSCSPEGLAHIGSYVESWIDRYMQKLHTFPIPRVLPDPAKEAVKKWYDGKNPLEYTVFGPGKKYHEN